MAQVHYQCLPTKILVISAAVKRRTVLQALCMHFIPSKVKKAEILQAEHLHFLEEPKHFIYQRLLLAPVVAYLAL